MSKRAVLYARVSTDESAEKGYSLPSQLAACREYAARNDLDVIAELQEDYSGAKLDRPALNELRDRIARQEVDAVVVYSSDRWTRSLAHSLILREELQRAGIAFHLVNRGEIDDTPEDRLTGNIEAVFNEYWREKIIEACKRGRDSKAKSGRVICAGKPPYGYDFIDGELAPNLTEAPIVLMIYRWYVEGEGHAPLVDNAIARRLSEMGIPCPSERNGTHPRNRRSGMWNAVTIQRILKSETYAGVLHFGKLAGHNTTQRRPESEHILINVTPLVPRDLWEAAQERRKQNKTLSPRNVTHQYLVRGFITCACGSAMSGVHGNRYRCTQRFNRHKGLEEFCKMKEIDSQLLDALVWDYILDELQDKDRFEQKLRQAQQEEQLAATHKQERVTLIADLLARCEQEADELTNALRTVPSGGLMSKTLQEKITGLEKRYAGLQREYAEAQAAVGEVLSDDDIAQFLQFREDVIEGMTNATFEDKRQTIELLHVKVKIAEGKAQITCRIHPEPCILVYSLSRAGKMERAVP